MNDRELLRLLDGLPRPRILIVGDLILEINDRRIENVETLRQSFDEITRDQRPVTLLKVERGIHTRFLELEADWNE